ncbi:MAG TPA: hypothetical protein PLF21_00720, partial [Exilispira sp.]|nr:hypothetical protein [Exilispira sp.]
MKFLSILTSISILLVFLFQPIILKNDGYFELIYFIQSKTIYSTITLLILFLTFLFFFFFIRINKNILFLFSIFLNTIITFILFLISLKLPFLNLKFNDLLV